MNTKENKKDNIKKDLLKALEKTLGVVTSACQQVNISRSLFYKYLNEDSDFKEKVEDINDICLDFVETQLFKRIKEGSDSCIFYYLNNKGKKRGYNTKEVVERVEDLPVVEINYTYK